MLLRACVDFQRDDCHTKQPVALSLTCCTGATSGRLCTSRATTLAHFHRASRRTADFSILRSFASWGYYTTYNRNWNSWQSSSRFLRDFAKRKDCDSARARHHLFERQAPVAQVLSSSWGRSNSVFLLALWFSSAQAQESSLDFSDCATCQIVVYTCIYIYIYIYFTTYSVCTRSSSTKRRVRAHASLMEIVEIVSRRSQTFRSFIYKTLVRRKKSRNERLEYLCFPGCSTLSKNRPPVPPCKTGYLEITHLGSDENT